MRCRVCDYRLWNLHARRCPECGTEFLPSTYDFVPGSVQFCCPHCDRTYYGTDHRGHLVPRAFTCAGCGQAIDMDAMVLRPTEGVAEERTQALKMPWLDAGHRARRMAWLGTVGMALVKPHKLMRALPTDSRVGPAWGFAILTALAIAGVVTLPLLVIAAIGAILGNPADIGFLVAIGAILTGGTAVILLAILLWGLLAHAILRATGPTFRGMGRTYEALCYASGANVVSAVPCLGLYVGWLWWVVSAVIALKEGQRVHVGRAALAIIPPPVLALGTFIGLYIWLVLTVMTSLKTTLANPPGLAPTAGNVVAALRTYAYEHDGEFPQHAVQLLADEYATPGDFLGTGAPTQLADIAVGDLTLADWATLTPEERIAVAEDVAADLPEGTSAYRVGDYVFTCPGMNLNTADPELWLFIDSLGSGTTATPGAAPLIHVVGKADGSTATFIGPNALPLTEQNRLRARNGLPPLPDPATVTPDSPAVRAP